jgi:hypothetical protein
MDYYLLVLAALKTRGPIDQSLRPATDTFTWTTTFNPGYKDDQRAQSLASYLARDLREAGGTAAALAIIYPNQLVLTYKLDRSLTTASMMSEPQGDWGQNGHSLTRAFLLLSRQCFLIKFY